MSWGWERGDGGGDGDRFPLGRADGEREAEGDDRCARSGVRERERDREPNHPDFSSLSGNCSAQIPVPVVEDIPEPPVVPTFLEARK